MKRTIILILVLAAGATALVFAYRQMSKERKLAAAREQPVAATARVKPGPNGEGLLRLDEATQQRIALKVERVASAKMTPELQGYGRVLDPAPLAGLAAELAAAQAAAAASQKEFDRLKLLNEQENASARALQAAEAAARRDQILVESLRTRLMSGWGAALAERPDLAVLVRSLAALESALVRIDLPAGQVLNAPPSSARIVAASSGNTSAWAKLLGPAPNADPQMQGQGFLFLMKTSSLRLVPGMAVGGYLQLQREPLDGFTIPDSAVVRHTGRGWVYVQTGADTFARREIALDHRTEAGWFVRAGVAADERVVVQGAQALLSEEQKYQIKMFE